jgi:hypothetical protein
LVESSKQGHWVYTRAQAQEPIMMWSPTWHYFWDHILGPAQEKKNALKMKTQLLGQDPKLYHFFIQYLKKS